MVKVTIEDSKGVNKVVGNAIFAIIPGAENTDKVATVICSDGVIDRRAVTMGLANLVHNAIGAISDSETEKKDSCIVFLKEI